MEKIAAVCTAIYLALIVSGCAREEVPPVSAKLVYCGGSYSRLNKLYSIGNDYFAEMVYYKLSDMKEGIYIRKFSDPSSIHRYIAPGGKSVGRMGVEGFSTYNNKLYFFVNGKQPAIFDPDLDEIVELHNESPYLDDYCYVWSSFRIKEPLNYAYYYDLYGSAGAAYRRGEEVTVPEGLNLGYINPKKLHEYSTFEKLFYTFNDGSPVNYEFLYGYNDKLFTWFSIHEKESKILFGHRNHDGIWEGREVEVLDPKNRLSIGYYNIGTRYIRWEILSPEHFIGPYSPYPGSAAMSLDVLDTKGRVHETGCYIVDDYAVSPNGRHVIAYGGYKNEAGEDIGGLLVFEISYQATITVKGAVLRDHGSIDGKTLKLLRQGQKCTVLEHSEFKDYVDGVEDCWYKIRLPNKREGWVFGAQLDFD